MTDVDNKYPLNINITIASAQEAMEYWLSNVVFRDDVRIKKVCFSHDEHFVITLNRSKMPK